MPPAATIVTSAGRRVTGLQVCLSLGDSLYSFFMIVAADCPQSGDGAASGSKRSYSYTSGGTKARGASSSRGKRGGGGGGRGGKKKSAFAAADEW